MKVTVKEYENEMEKIENICAKFAWLLIENSNAPYNNFIEPYFEMLMNEELQKLSALPNYSRETYENLKEMKEKHQSNVQILKKAIAKNDSERVTLEDISNYKDELLGLKHCGNQFKGILETAKWTKDRDSIASRVDEKELNLDHNWAAVINRTQGQTSFWKKLWFFK